jgi:hypothetical protein
MPDAAQEIIDMQARIDIAMLKGELLSIKLLLSSILAEGLIVIGLIYTGHTH